MRSPAVVQDRCVTELRGRGVGGLMAGAGSTGLDSLRQAAVPLVPEIQLHLAEDAIVLWARMEAEAGGSLLPPYWASAWLGGQALARYVLDHPSIVAGRRVLDLAAGSGLAGIAAGLAGAAAVTANDIDPNALVAIEMNAKANDVEIALSGDNLLDGIEGFADADVVLAGDVFYTQSMAEVVSFFLDRMSANGAHVLVGDPGRADLPHKRLEVVASYQTAEAATFTDAEIERVYVLQLS
jgi:predicted nicotinamide N-methyase